MLLVKVDVVMVMVWKDDCLVFECMFLGEVVVLLCYYCKVFIFLDDFSLVFFWLIGVFVVYNVDWLFDLLLSIFFVVVLWQEDGSVEI